MQTYPWVVPLETSHPKFSLTHPTLGQHRIHIKKAFHSKLFIKRLPKSCITQNSN